MRKSILLPLFLLIVLSQFSCYLDLDTTDTQVSRSISEAKKDNFFIASYRAKNLDSSIFKIRQAWVEESWQWKANLFTKQKKLAGFRQLNFIIDDKGGRFKNHDYLINWSMVNKIYGGASSEGNIYSFEIDGPAIPDSLTVYIKFIKNDRTSTVIGQFSLMKQ
ncbi:MAG: hypothetical protein ACTHNG_12500 [Ginsengibacter sp.]